LYSWSLVLGNNRKELY